MEKFEFLMVPKKLNFEDLNSKLYNAWPEQYEALKMMEWAQLLRTGLSPRWWNRPTRRGTSCLTTELKTDRQEEKAYKQFVMYVETINAKYDELEVSVRLLPDEES